MHRRTALALSALAVPAVLLPATAAAAAPGGGNGNGNSKAHAAHDTGHSSDKGNGNGTQVYRSTLMELNDSGATGKVMLRLRGDELTIRIKAEGLLPNAVHAQHIHGEGNRECPPMSAAGADGVLNVLEGAPFYGPIVTSLTVTGDTSPAAGLSVEIMPVADDKGRIDYRRTITLPEDVSNDLEDYQIVQHGVDLNGSGGYDAGPGESEIAPGVPLEVTVPANCGTIDHVGHDHSH